MNRSNILFDVDSLIEVMQAIKDGTPVECRRLEEPAWQDFDPRRQEIDTQNFKYRVKPFAYGEKEGTEPIEPKDLREGRIYKVKSLPDGDEGVTAFICVKSNCFVEQDGRMSLHFLWTQTDKDNLNMLRVADEELTVTASRETYGFGNMIMPYIEFTAGSLF